ncbi:MAG: RluA family pseudouridine synthase [Deltaproteobacteria bacterium]|jgi:RluA family pseudouridine synthase|nr:RluA family pseudouridine synthase [Deltaproteobacteria bacterium]
MTLRDYFDEPVDDPPAFEGVNEQSPPVVAGQVPEKADNCPAVSFLANILLSLDLSRYEPSLPEKLIDFGCFWLNDRPVFEPDFRLQTGQKYRFNWPRYGPVKFYQPDEKRIVYEDDGLIVYDKESGRPSQAVPHDNYNNVLAGLERLTGIKLRLANRLDAGTSGLIIASKNQTVAGLMGKSFSQSRIKKIYLALTCGPSPDRSEQTVTAAIAKAGPHYVARAEGPGRPAKTILKVLNEKENLLLWAAWPLTGKTHQIRLHLAFVGFPILGDIFYGGGPDRRLRLRAAGLRFFHPTGGREIILGLTDEDLAGL